MKLYSKHSGASISMHDDAQLRTLLRETIKREAFNYVLESGTYIGLGSTRFVSECFREVKPPKSFVTIEACWDSWMQARNNLTSFPFVKCLWGLSLELKQSLNFIRSDEFLLNHHRYEDIYIDNIKDPVTFYSREVQGKLRSRRSRKTVKYVYDLWTQYRGEGLLKKCLLNFKDSNPLVILDAAGGTGLLEFMTLEETMRGHRYVVLLDDIHHVKHYRSLQRIQADPAFQLLGVSQQNGWALAKHTPAGT